MNKTILNIAAVTFAAFINPALGAHTEVIECDLYPVQRYIAEEGPTVQETATACAARHAGVKTKQVSVIAVDHDGDKVMVKVIFSRSVKTFLVVDQEPIL